MEKRIANYLSTDPGNRTESAQKILDNFKREVVQTIKQHVRKMTPIMDKKIADEKKQLETTMNERLPENERQLIIAQIEERIKQLETDRHMKIRDNIATKSRIEMETIGKYWIRQNKDHTPRDTIKSLRKQDSDQENPTYEEDSKKMAEMTRDYHQELQNIGSQETTEEDYNEVLLHLNTKLNQADKNLLATFIRYEEVEEALHLLPNGTAAGLDGLPHEFWKTFAS